MFQADAALAYPRARGFNLDTEAGLRAALHDAIERALAMLDDLDGNSDLEGQELFRHGELTVVDLDLEASHFMRGGHGA